jgi:hypothetical protein
MIGGMDKEGDMTAVGFLIRIARAGLALIGIPYGLMLLSAEAPSAILMTIAAVSGTLAVWYVVRIFNLGFDSTSRSAPAEECLDEVRIDKDCGPFTFLRATLGS